MYVWEKPVLVAAKEIYFTKHLAETMDEMSVNYVRCGNTMDEIMTALGKGTYSMIYVNSVIEGSTLLEVLQRIHETYPDLKILVSLISDSLSGMKKLMISKEVFFITMPFSRRRLIELMYRISEKNRPYNYPYIADFLYVLGITTKYSGFSYLCTAISLCIDDPRKKCDLVRSIYGGVAQYHGTEGSLVDRSIRHLSGICYKKGLVPKLTSGQIDEKLTNYELICAAGDLFTVRRKSMNCCRW